MTTFYMGNYPQSGSQGAAGYTSLNMTSPASGTGHVVSWSTYFQSNGSGYVVGTFYGSSTSWTKRDSASIGNVTSGSTQTFTGLTIDVETNDIIGEYHSGGGQAYFASGGSGGYKLGDQFGAGTQTYGTDSMIRYIYATGATAAAGNPYYYYLQQ
jgi:hypothetical protein